MPRRTRIPLFAHWQKRMTKPKARLTRGRAAVVKARLREGYKLAQMKQAIDACCSSEFHMGENDRNTAYNDLTIILRSGEKLEQFMAMADRQGPSTTESPEVRRLLRESADAMQRGDTAAQYLLPGLGQRFGGHFLPLGVLLLKP